MTHLATTPLLAALLLTSLGSPALGLDPAGDPLPAAPEAERAFAAPAPLLSTRKPVVRIEAFYEDVELGRITFEPALSPDVKLRDLERRRIGVRASFGEPELSGYVAAFGEGFEHPSLVTDFDNFGMSGGILGAPQIGRLRRGGKLLLPYRVGLTFVGGYEDDALADYFLWYGEFEGEFGVAVDYSGFQPSAGLYFTTLSGSAETDIGFATITEDFYGFNGGAYAELKYDGRRTPVYGRIRGVFGDVEGVTLALGVKF